MRQESGIRNSRRNSTQEWDIPDQEPGNTRVQELPRGHHGWGTLSFKKVGLTSHPASKCWDASSLVQVIGRVAAAFMGGRSSFRALLGLFLELTWVMGPGGRGGSVLGSSTQAGCICRHLAGALFERFKRGLSDHQQVVVMAFSGLNHKY